MLCRNRDLPLSLTDLGLYGSPIVHVFGHVCVPGHSIVVGTEIFDQKKPSTYQAGSNEVSFVHICPVVQKLLRYKGKNLWPFIYIEICVER